jgi:hypothetical protein
MHTRRVGAFESGGISVDASSQIKAWRSPVCHVHACWTVMLFMSVQYEDVLDENHKIEDAQ